MLSALTTSKTSAHTAARVNALKLALAAVLLVSASAAAYRPFDGTDAATAEFGEFELELGPFGFFHSSTESNLYLPYVVLNFGFAPGWEVVLQGRNEVLLEGSGNPERISDTGVFLKGVLFDGTLQGTSGVSVATEFGVLLPTYNADGEIGASVALIFSYAWEALTLHLNLQTGVTRERFRPDGTSKHNLDLFGSLIAEGPRKWPVRPVAEIFVDDEFGNDPTLSGLVGAIWPVTEHFTFDVGLRAAELSNSTMFEVRAGLTWSISFFGEPGVEAEHGAK